MNPETTSESQRLIAQIHTSRKRRYAKAVLLILAAVAAGVVIGVGGSVMYFRNHFHRVPPRPAAIVQSLLEHMHSQLTLTSTEEDKLKDIISRHMTEVDELREATFEESHKVFQRMNAEIESVLGSDRYKIWDEFKTKRWGAKMRGKYKGGRFRGGQSPER